MGVGVNLGVSCVHRIDDRASCMHGAVPCAMARPCVWLFLKNKSKKTPRRRCFKQQFKS